MLHAAPSCARVVGMRGDGEKGGTNGSRAAHVFRQVICDLRRVRDLFFCPPVAELTVPTPQRHSYPTLRVQAYLYGFLTPCL